VNSKRSGAAIRRTDDRGVRADMTASWFAQMRLEELAQASERSHPRQALEVHQRRVTRLVQTSGNHSYAEAQRLIKRMRTIAEQGGEADGQATFESDLLAKHHAKRNFIKLMSGDTATHRIRR
jgi:uncharacterized Zn finger protein